MTKRIDYDKKETCFQALKVKGTIIAGAAAAGVSPQTILDEMKRSALFERKVREAQELGRQGVGDTAVENIIDLASEGNKDVRSRLTANIAIANWAVSGFRGTTQVAGKIVHEIKVRTGIPRPKYDVTIEPTEEDKETLKKLNEGKPIKRIDEKKEEE